MSYGCIVPVYAAAVADTSAVPCSDERQRPTPAQSPQGWPADTVQSVTTVEREVLSEVQLAQDSQAAFCRQYRATSSTRHSRSSPITRVCWLRSAPPPTGARRTKAER